MSHRPRTWPVEMCQPLVSVFPGFGAAVVSAVGGCRPPERHCSGTAAASAAPSAQGQHPSAAGRPAAPCRPPPPNLYRSSARIHLSTGRARRRAPDRDCGGGGGWQTTVSGSRARRRPLSQRLSLWSALIIPHIRVKYREELQWRIQNLFEGASQRALYGVILKDAGHGEVIFLQNDSRGTRATGVRRMKIKRPEGTYRDWMFQRAPHRPVLHV